MLNPSAGRPRAVPPFPANGARRPCPARSKSSSSGASGPGEVRPWIVVAPHVRSDSAVERLPRRARWSTRTANLRACRARRCPWPLPPGGAG